mgnify:CR=1 FL=1
MIKKIGGSDMAWGAGAMIMKVGAGVMLFPFVLSRLTPEQAGIWTIFTTIQILVTLLDFGFNDSFARNVGYVFAGVRELRRNGYQSLESAASDDDVDWNLMKGLIFMMKLFFGAVTLLMALLLVSVGTWYISTLITDYQGNHAEVWWSWVLLIAFMCWNLYSMYYQALLQGRGLVKEFSKAVVWGYLSYLVVAIVLVYLGGGLIAIVGSQFLSMVIIRLLCHHFFYTKEMKSRLASAHRGDCSHIIRAIAPNAVKVGLTGMGGIIINKSSTFIGSEFLDLSTMASFGITMQLVVVVSRVAALVTTVYQPNVFEWRVIGEVAKIRRLFWISTVVLFGVYILAGISIDLLGNFMLVNLMHSNTAIVTGGIFWIMLLQSCLEANHVNAATFLLTKNEVPFFKASLISAAATLILLIIGVVWLDLGLWGMVLAPTIAQGVYQNWKWPSVVIKELNASSK